MGFFPNKKTEDVCVSVRGVYSGVDIDLQEQEGGGGQECSSSWGTADQLRALILNRRRRGV